ncbi:MAG: ATP-grasp ribosomal peptide maturase, partial [Actinomycetota bacterium]|nr:ATP-grasp ribosomal peptide maturase [Actinomycetota bacterium]
PPTLVTNRPDAVSRFARSAPHGVVGKTFGPNSVTEDGVLKVAYTHRLDAGDLDHLRGVEVSAHQIQDWVDKDHEARVVVVGDQVFGVAIHAHSDRSRTDWRADFDALTYDLVQVPSEVDKGVRRYMATLGLLYAAFDFCVDRDGRWAFLESNGAGQYAWLEAATNAPISGALVDLLVTGRCR